MVKSSMIIDLEELKKLVEYFEKTSLSELEIEKEGIRIRLSKREAKEINLSLPSVKESVTPVPSQEKVEEKGEEEGLVTISSPMVGTFYRSPAPDAPPFVEEGDEVNEDDVVCIIEAMKIMNEIKAEVKGRIRKVLVENGESVEFGQPLFLVEPL